jgi:hypothetical protein
VELPPGRTPSRRTYRDSCVRERRTATSTCPLGGTTHHPELEQQGYLNDRVCALFRAADATIEAWQPPHADMAAITQARDADASIDATGIIERLDALKAEFLAGRDDPGHETRPRKLSGPRCRREVVGGSRPPVGHWAFMPQRE